MARRWTDDEMRVIIDLWPNNSWMKIAHRLHRPRESVREKARRMVKAGLMVKAAARDDVFRARPASNAIKPDPHDFEAVKMDYCHKHNVTITELGERLKSDTRLEAELFRLAQTAKLTKGTGKMSPDVKKNYARPKTKPARLDDR